MKRLFLAAIFFFAALAPRQTFAAGVSAAFVGPSRVNVGQTFQVTVELRGAVDVDTVRLIGLFPPSLLSWMAAQPAGPFQSVSPGTFTDSQQGTFSFGTFTLGPYANGTVKTAVITLKALKTGTAVLRLLPGTEAYSAGEPSGPSAGSLTITIGEAPPVLPKTAPPGISVTVPATTPTTVISPSHPDPNKWYADPNVIVAWQPIKPIAFVFGSFDQSPEPLSYLPIADATTTFHATADGVWYVHLIFVYKDKTFGRADFPVRIDQTPPRTPAVVVEQTDVPATVPNQVLFGTVDETSGIDHYDVLIDGVRVTSTRLTFYPLQNLMAGTHVVEVIAFDAAGNHASGITSFTILGPGEKPSIFSSITAFFLRLTPLQRTIAGIIAAGGAFSWLWWLIRRRLREKKK
jgi:hypothetical protein